MVINKRAGSLPGGFEERYKSESLKDQIADDGMWGFIPAVTYSIDSPKGIKRLKKNQLLFDFIDRYFGEDPFAFEPNMRDDRYVFLPDDVGHQGIGITVSEELPGFLEIGQFWYPSEFTEKAIPIGPAQVYIPVFSMKPGDEIAGMVRRVYMGEKTVSDRNYCTFPFTTDLVVTLSGNFMDRTDQSVKTIKNALKASDPAIKRNGEGLVEFIQRMVK